MQSRLFVPNPSDQEAMAALLQKLDALTRDPNSVVRLQDSSGDEVAIPPGALDALRAAVEVMAQPLPFTLVPHEPP